MKLSSSIRIAIQSVILGTSIFAWVLLLVNPGHIMTLEHCHVSTSGASATSLKMLLDMNPISLQLMGWGLMVIAMMLPKLILPIQFIYAHGFKRNRLLCATLFVFAYVFIWMLAGLLMLGVIMGANLLLPNSYLPAVLVACFALIWQFSPLKQRFLNHGHEHRILAAFGWAAFRDALIFGAMHGLYCVAAGWALMLFPMLLPEGHNLAMLVVTFIMLDEHLEHPTYPTWRFKFRFKLIQIIVAQSSIKLKKVLVPKN